jgi:hypothetical protein
MLLQDYTTLYKAINDTKRHYATLYSRIQDYTTLYNVIQQGGISSSTNQRFCLHFCPKPIRMRKTLHHMKFVNKHMGLLQSFAASVFLGFFHEIDICCS